MEKDKRILVFNVNWLGDVLFSTAVLRNIRRHFPKSFIACVIPSRCYSVLKGNPHLDEIIIFDDKDRHRNLIAQLRFARQLRSKKFDTAILLHRSFTRALICRLAGIPERIGYHTTKRGFLLTKAVPTPEKDTLHRIDYYLNIIEKSGYKVEDRFTEFFFSEEDVKSVEHFLGKHNFTKKDFLAVLNPGGNWMPKRWPREYWAELAERIMARFNAKVVFTGSSHDISLVRQIKEKMKEPPIIACGALNIKQLGALCKKADLIVTADTGPLHIANAVGAKRIIALFGPTSPLITGPYPLKNVKILRKDTGCERPCYVVHCKDNRCMKAITPLDVLQEIEFK
jgi:heptosyltransferase II